MAKKSLAAVEAPKPDYSSGQYNHVARGAQLVAIQQLHLEMDGSPEHYRSDALKLSVDRELRGCYYEAESQSAAAIFRYSVTAKVGRSRAFHCRAEFAVLYRVPEDSTEDAAKMYAIRVGMIAAYPYFRAVAAQMAWNAGLELPPMPSIASMPVLGKSEVTGHAEDAK